MRGLALKNFSISAHFSMVTKPCVANAAMYNVRDVWDEAHAALFLERFYLGLEERPSGLLAFRAAADRGAGQVAVLRANKRRAEGHVQKFRGRCMSSGARLRSLLPATG
jgi:hypothetical protein